MRKYILFSIIVFAALWFLAVTPALARTYSTNFPLTENPISENGNWTKSSNDNAIRTTGGHAVGTQTISNSFDSSAQLTDTWGADQTAEGVVYASNPLIGDSQEVELHLRSNVMGNYTKTYEITWSTNPGNGYFILVRWNGDGTCSWLQTRIEGDQYIAHDGDVLKATIVGNTINAYKNDVLQATVTDAGQNITDPVYCKSTSGVPIALGNPGLGQDGSTNGVDTFGFKSFTATDGSAKPGDLNNDGKVDVTDLGILLSNWGSTTKPPSDLNQDGYVNVTDLGILLSNWG